MFTLLHIANGLMRIYIYIYICIYVLMGSISMCGRSGYLNSGKTHSCGRFGRGLHQCDFSEWDGAYMWIMNFKNNTKQ